jgi:small subunit ribosomal protein S4
MPLQATKSAPVTCCCAEKENHPLAIDEGFWDYRRLPDPTETLGKGPVFPGESEFMGRYTGPKARVNRRLRTMVYESAGAVRAMERRDNPPGMHTRGRRPSNYGLALMEKQKIKHYYGLGEKQLRRYYNSVTRKAGNTGENLLLMCERRLDNIVRRSGLTSTRPQARQGIAHGHFQVNGVKVTKPSYMLRPGDVITVRRRKNLLQLYQRLSADDSPETVEWLTFDSETLRVTMQGNPGPSDISLPVDVNMVIEFLSR